LSRILGVDYGGRRIGLALSDPLWIIAKPFKVIDRKKTEDYLSAILEIAKENDVERIVVGVPIKG
jgi:putative Holliday junction resolvase